MADEKNEPSAQTKALLERTRAAKAKAGDSKPVVTVIEDAQPVNTPTPQAGPLQLDQAAEQFMETLTSQPPTDNSHVAAGAEKFPEPVTSNDELKAVTRTMSRTEAERERGRQIVQKNEEARERAQANRRRDENEERKLREQYED